jgi:hypothetical protein
LRWRRRSKNNGGLSAGEKVVSDGCCGWKKRGRRRTEKQKIKGSLAHNTMVDGVVKLGKDLISVGRDV